MLAVIAPTQPAAVGAATLAGPTDCCAVGPKPTSLAHKPDQAREQQLAPMTSQALQPQPSPQQQQAALLASANSLQLKQHMAALHLQADQAASSGGGAAAGGLPPLLQGDGDVVSAAIAPPPPAPLTGSGRARRRSSRCEARKAAPSVSGYSSDSYWNSRYAEKSTHFDWFFNYSALAALINGTCDKAAGPCLHVGCGNSGLSDGMVEDGFRVVNVDISPVVIEQMQLMEQLPGQTWEVADCRSMPQYADGSFGSVLDKGTLDAVLCSSHGVTDAAVYIDEVYRLLAPGGTFLLISLGQPQARLVALHAAPPAPPSVSMPYLSPLLQQRVAAEAAAAAAASASTRGPAAAGSSAPKDWSWQSVDVYLLPKPTLYLQSESSLTGKPIISVMQHSDKDMPVHWLGPFTPGAELDAVVAQQELDLREFFTAFACTKPGGSGGGGGAAAPEGAAAPAAGGKQQGAPAAAAAPEGPADAAGAVQPAA